MHSSRSKERVRERERRAVGISLPGIGQRFSAKKVEPLKKTRFLV